MDAEEKLSLYEKLLIQDITDTGKDYDDLPSANAVYLHRNEYARGLTNGLRRAYRTLSTVLEEE